MRCGSLWAGVSAVFALGAWNVPTGPVLLEAEHATLQQGAAGEDRKPAASGGVVLGNGFGGRVGDFAEYPFELPETLASAQVAVRYARDLEGTGQLQVTVDGRALGFARYANTGGWGEAEEHFAWTTLPIGELPAGRHTLRLTILPPPDPRLALPDDPLHLPTCAALNATGGRADRNSAGQGRNVVLYTGEPSQVFYATYTLGSIFSAVDGVTVRWDPDHVQVRPTRPAVVPTCVNIDRIEIGNLGLASYTTSANLGINAFHGVVEDRHVCVTQDDVIVARIRLRNSAATEVRHRIDVAGDCRQSRGWRGKPGGEKLTQRTPRGVLLVDRNVLPQTLPGLCLAVGGSMEPRVVEADPPGTYRLLYEVEIPAGRQRELTLACAMHPEPAVAQLHLEAVLRDPDPILTNRRAWVNFFERQVPRFRCSDRGLEELYAFRWYLLRFSTVGGDLGYFQYPVVLEGRQAYQTFCCYSAPFLAFDLSWAGDGDWAFGQIATLVLAAYGDGRFPWYTAPDTNRVPIHHRSGTGLSLMPLAAWKHYVVHGSLQQMRLIYPGLKKNLEWWIADRDPDGNGLFVIDHQLETGQDDLLRWPDPTLRYESVDATSYAHANLTALANLARVLGYADDAEHYAAYANKVAQTVNTELWDATARCWRDRNPADGMPADLLPVTMFYPLFAGIAQPEHLDVVRAHLLNPQGFAAAHPVPALSQADPRFDPSGYWMGPAWPAATSHVLEGFATTAKTLDRTWTPAAGTLLRQAARNHLQPRADFYERYHPWTGAPLSKFRDYMHSWWIDLIIRHVVGLEPQADGGLVIDPLPTGLTYFTLEGVGLRDRRVDVSWQDPRLPGPRADAGLTVRVEGEIVIRDADFEPGNEPVHWP
ncbi:MAG TPA: trehalase family glycosidase [Phycisphaerae bacterium]|nr:trehalase family glycosidase [Phycisphaerae bacterium]HNU45427.1 trehalase family glycosidase [Phycisphaerae bacterium]